MQYVKARKRKVRKTVYFQYFKFQKGNNSYKTWRKLTTLELDRMLIRRRWHAKFQLNTSKHVGEKCGKLWLIDGDPDGDPDGRTDGRMDGRKDGRHHTIIRPIWRRAYKNWPVCLFLFCCFIRHPDIKMYGTDRKQCHMYKYIFFWRSLRKFSMLQPASTRKLLLNLLGHSAFVWQGDWGIITLSASA